MSNDNRQDLPRPPRRERQLEGTWSLAVAGAALFFFGTGPLAHAQWGAGVEEPRWFRMRLSEMNVKLNVEGEWEKRTAGGKESEREYLLVEPTLGVGLSGSVYHPNLLRFDLATDVGPTWQEVTQDPPGGTRESTRFLHRYHAGMDLLRKKPYATHFFADKDISYQNFDFFSRGRVDSLRYGGNTGYAAGPVPFRLSAFRLEEEITGTRSDSRLDETTLSFHATNGRGKTGHTEFTYRMLDFFRDREGTPRESGVEHTANLFDTETWGKKGWIRLRSAALYHRLDGTATDTESKTVRENLDLAHSKNLSSSYRYSFDLRTSGPVENRTHDAGAMLRHQLYESLTSALDIHGWSLSSESPDSTSDSTRYGARLDESYIKRLPAKGRLSLAYSVTLDHERRENTGLFLFLVDEPHTLTDGIPTFLNQPNVDTVRSVTDPSGAPYAEMLDYLLIPQGAQTEIRRVPAGRIPNGSTVLVDYTAAAPPSDSFSTLSQFARIRLELFDRLVALYGRLNRVDNRGGESLVLKDINDRVVGAEISWRWLKAGGEYEDYRSNLSPFRTARLFQTLSFTPTDASTLTLDFSQTRSTFLDTGLTRRSYSNIGRYRTRLFYFLIFSAEGGIRIERGRGFDQDLKTLRMTLDFSYGRMTANAEYEFQDEKYLGETRDRHSIFLRAKRTF